MSFKLKGYESQLKELAAHSGLTPAAGGGTVVLACHKRLRRSFFTLLFGRNVADWLLNDGKLDFVGFPIDMQPKGCIMSAMVAGEDKVFKALADSSRRQLLDRLRAKAGLTLGELCQSHDMTRQAVTKHLVLLEAANLVVAVKRGREKLHYLNPVPIHEIYMRWIGKFERQQVQALFNLKQALKENDHDKT